MKTQAQRKEDGKAIFKAGKVDLIDEGKNIFWVGSQKGHGGYVVFYNMAECECPDFRNRLLICKHWYAVNYYKLDLIEKQKTTKVIEVKA
jgi:SWIM zinc finger